MSCTNGSYTVKQLASHSGSAGGLYGVGVAWLGDVFFSSSFHEV
jgi:hypothetical protein